MIRTEIKSCFEVNCWETSYNTTLAIFLQAFVDCWNEVLWNNTANDSVNKFITMAFIRFKFNPNITILTFTTRLFLMFTLNSGSSFNGFAISNLWLRNINFNEFPSVRDQKDSPILATALIEDIDIFITGDKDFLVLEIDRPEIMTMKDFLGL